MNGAEVSLASVAAVMAQVVLCVIGAPLLVGLMRTVRCRLEGRVGPPVVQTWRDVRKLLQKQRTQPERSSIFFTSAPVVLVATTLAVIVFIPMITTRTIFSGGSDLFAIVFLLLAGSMSLALAALDTGTAFGGMGSSRLMAIIALAEPALLVAILAVAAPLHSSSLSVIVVGSLHHSLWIATPQRLLALGAFVIVVLAESGRLPVDNPATHLELTMIHEALMLEYSGPDLAFVVLGESMRLTVLLALLSNLFFPWGISTSLRAPSLVVAVIGLVAKVTLLAIAIAAGEVAVAKLRLFRVPELLAGAFVLSVLAVVSSLVIS
jgi:formate hydrogenlyase subunit 4